MTTLPGFRDHCRRMADDEDQSPDARALWTRLADEVDDYLDHDDEAALDDAEGVLWT